MMMKILSHKTAIKRKRLSAPVRQLFEQNRLRGRVLDYGCGYGDDVRLLRRRGVDIVGYDPHHAPCDGTLLLPGFYDVVYCGYVLNVLPTLTERWQAVFAALACVKPPHGLLYLVVRSWREVALAAERSDDWKEYGDGWVTSASTFQTGFEDGELKQMVDAIPWAGVYVTNLRGRFQSMGANNNNG
jgi:DNA phosphorothioation-associated putative methyltransferase